jgi:hypothetical protein
MDDENEKKKQYTLFISDSTGWIKMHTQKERRKYQMGTGYKSSYQY